MNRSRPLVLGSAAAAALLANYWLLEDAFADRHNFDASWISDLSTRSESSGAIFVAFGIASGLALAAYALVLLGTLGRDGRESPAGERERRSSLVRWGLIALLVSAVAVVVAGAAPLSCAEGLEARCNLAEDGVDILHSVATAAEIGATVLAFALIGRGLVRDAGDPVPSGDPRSRVAVADRRLGILTLALGAVWLALTIVTGVSYLNHGIDDVKGAFQRADQVVFALWLLALTTGVRTYPP